MLQRAKAVADAARRTHSTWLDTLRSSPVVTDLPPAWVFLGPPGVGKGTYASRMASKLGVPHIAAGDLVRAQIRDRTPQGLKVCHPALPPLAGTQGPAAAVVDLVVLQIAGLVTAGDLIPDTLVLEVRFTSISPSPAVLPANYSSNWSCSYNLHFSGFMTGIMRAYSCVCSA